jgi:3-oxoacyl-[acyl-carrier-protein] synthase II
MQRVVVTGIGMINSLGHSVQESFKAIVDGETGIDRITLFDPSNFSAQIAGEVKNFDPTAILGKKESKKADRFIQLGIHAAQEAMRDAKFVDENNNKIDDELAVDF